MLTINKILVIVVLNSIELTKIQSVNNYLFIHQLKNDVLHDLTINPHIEITILHDLRVTKGSYEYVNYGITYTVGYVTTNERNPQHKRKKVMNKL